ncbi:MAG: MMPL family transporter [Deltaproteobacteria bacterium]|nr:MMPL family transporter [Deltaproteobacteria bacterium]
MAFGIGKLADAGGRAAGRMAAHVSRQYPAWIAGCAVLTAVSILFVTRLELKSDFIELLPQDYRSVVDLRRIIDKVGGLGNLSIAFESSDVKASQRLADDLAGVLDRDFRGRIRYYDYKIDAIKKYYTDNAPLFMEPADLEEIRDRIDRKIRAEKLKNNPLFIDLSGSVEKDAQLDFGDIERKYRKETEGYARYIDGYYTGENGRLLAMLIKPSGGSTNMPAMKRLVADITAAIDRLNPAGYAPDMRFAFAGNYKTGLEEFETLKGDILGTALLCVALVALAVFAYFRRIRAVTLLGIACVAAVMWTFCVTYFAIGYLNTVTAFLGAIIAGTGINYGIILLARYFEERRLGTGVDGALKVAMEQTVAATFGAAATTAVSFGIFLLAEVKSFSQFGFIGGVGVMLVWAASYTFLPALVILSERLRPSVSGTEKTLLSDRANLSFLTWPLRYPRAVLAVFSAGAVLSIVSFARYLPDSLEYDMSRLRTRSSLESGTAKLDHRISEIFDVSMTPAVILSKDPAQGAAICRALLAKKKRDDDASGIEGCRSVTSYLPEGQEEKLEVVRDLRRMLTGPALGFLTGEQKRQVEDLKKSLPTRPLTLDVLPPEMTRFYTDKEGNVGTFVYVYPRAGRTLWNAENLFRFTADIRTITLGSGEVITSSGEAIIFADLLKLMKKDGPLATAVSFLGVFMLVVLIFGSLRSSVYVTSSLLFGTLWMVGLMSLIGTKLNFFNFVALPMTFGIGVDYSINIYQRYMREGPGSMDKVLRRTGTAVFLCSLTTIIGYFTLIMADSNALVSLGGLAILGEFTCLAAAMIGLPALVAVAEERRKARASKPDAGPR